ncbi:MAG: GNAT family N-acetyltransferase [Bacilli bacterium]|nr:GNAT family N-acetyltransferase [Bacilli bacterium]
MIKEKDLIVNKFEFKYLKSVMEIYYSCFEKYNRFSIFKLLFNIFNKNAEMYLLLKENKIKSFIYTINYQGMSFILYLAVDKKEQSKGYGSYLLNWYLNKVSNKLVFANIDEINIKFKDNSERKKRLEFYIRNGFHLTKYLSTNASNRCHIISNSDVVDINKYVELDKTISKFFFTNTDKIEEFIVSENDEVNLLLK